MVSKDGESVVGQGTGRYVENAGKQLAGEFIHVGDHQKQALGSGEGGSEGAALKGTVHSARSAGFGLHLRDPHLLAEEIQPAVRGPVVCNFRHWGRRGDGIDRCDIGKGVCYVCSCGIPINGHGFCHLT